MMSSAVSTTAPTPGLSTPSKSPFDSVSILRSASSPHLPSLVNSPSSKPSLEPGGIRRTYSETVLSDLDNGVRQHSLSKSVSISDITLGAGAVQSIPRHKSHRFSQKPKFTISKFAVTEKHEREEFISPPKAAIISDRLEGETKARPVVSSLSSFARKSWTNASRSPSPSPRGPSSEDLQSNPLPNVASIHPSLPIKVDPVEIQVLPVTEGDRPIKRRKSLIGRKSKRPLSAFIGKGTPIGEDVRPGVPTIPKSFSTDRLPSLVRDYHPLERPPIIPRSTSSDRLQSLVLDSPRKRDELWSNFRSLDGEFQKFLSKTSIQKTNMIRAVLLPFLRTHSEHPSNKNLRAEDLDRRVNIFNKWWTGLLEMLNGRNGQSVSGNDRSAILEGVTGIMTRPEWKYSLSSIAARSERSRPSLKSRSSTSLESTSSEFLAESVIHNIRNTFVQNLLSQMAFVVDKMSMRNIPASLVIFCGRAAAYAFFCCPGVAEILVRLWSPPSETVRRVLDEAGVYRNADLRLVAEKISVNFPAHLRALGFRSLPSLMRHLRRIPQLPLSSAYIPWYGPWVSRWVGRDSDLFFVFIKHFHVLVYDHLPEAATKTERACAPCYALVQAQLLAVLDGTIHRSVSPPYPEAPKGPQPITFDDVLGAEASATALPLAAPNTVRLMAENRLIMLLREFLSDTSKYTENVRRAFAESFGDLLKAVSRRTSVYDHNACFTLCDFLEEAFVIMARYYNDFEDPASFLDWPFWLDVCKKMTESNNSMTEVRLYAFLYGLWGFITSDDCRKRDLCLDWLLEEDYFQQQFNHWCPMVRAYYMRLLCWRIARIDGAASELNLTILTVLSDRLRTTWCYYLHSKNNAEQQGIAAPSTAACNPAPARRLLIIRNDIHPAPGGVYLSFDGLLAASSAAQPTAYERHHSLESLFPAQTSQNERGAPRSSSPGKKRWGLLRSMIPFTNGSADRSKTAAPASELNAVDGVKKSSEQASSGKVDPGGIVNVPAGPQSQTQAAAVIPKTKFQTHSFKFSLEWLDRLASTPSERRLYPPRLPLPSQTPLDSRRHDGHENSMPVPHGAAIASSKYAGRALAEWAVIIAECQSFFERRKQEGVPTSRLVETPTLGVESFRKQG